MKKNKDNSPHYIWGDVCDGWRLADEPERSIIHERMPSRAMEERHYHERSAQFFFVLEGELTMEVNGETIVLRRHEGLPIAALLPHQARNESDRDVEFLVISQPTTRGDRVLA